MKIRTITTGFEYHPQMKQKDFAEIALKTNKIRDWFKLKNYTIQTIRMSTQPWNQYAQSKKDLLGEVKRLEQWMNDYAIDYFNIGPTNKMEQVSWLHDIIKSTTNCFCTVSICDKQNIFYETAWKTAKAMKDNALIEAQGFANLRFAALCNISPHTPFFPASYHQGKNPSFGIGLENSDLVYESFSKIKHLNEIKDTLFDTLMNEYKPIENQAKSAEKKFDLTYNGLDVSICTSVDKKESIAFAFEHIFKEYHFGDYGTLSIAKLITETLQALPLKTVGYCGLMLPLLEDYGLALRNNDNNFSVSDLLLYSAVCGTGLDTIPLPGSISVDEIYHILCDVASLSIKLQKPLSVRLLPVPGKEKNDFTEFDFSYFENSKVM